MLGIIGGSGLYELDGLIPTQQLQVQTPFGTPSGTVDCGIYQEQPILFISRHGDQHQLLPHEINYRANIYALKQLGARQILSISAAGSLREDIKPGDLGLVNQYFDHSRGNRAGSFFGNGVCAHVANANPCCPALNGDIQAAAKRSGQPLHRDLTYASVEGPRLGTSAESHFLRNGAKADVVGMTNIPEVFLAREAQMAYSSICLITDYDCWMEDQRQHVSVDKVFEVYRQALQKALGLVTDLLASPLSQTPVSIRQSLNGAVLTPSHKLSHAHQLWLNVLKA
ncbi:MTAP family purine nucleoside phosphorylase [Porticoccaceae bacterium]|nr:MTAP family purine nucleoside phosphorylase [Porticoccaceae bacterium]